MLISWCGADLRWGHASAGNVARQAAQALPCTWVCSQASTVSDHQCTELQSV